MNFENVSFTQVLDTIPAVTNILIVTNLLFTISNIILWHLYKKRGKEIGGLRLKNALLQIEKSPHDLDFEKICDIYEDMIKTEQKQLFNSFSDKAVSTMSLNINSQEDIKYVPKFFTAWYRVKKDLKLMSIYKRVVEKTRVRVCKLSEEYLESLPIEPARDRLANFENVIQREFFSGEDTYKLSEYFSREIDSMKGQIDWPNRKVN